MDLLFSLATGLALIVIANLLLALRIGALQAAMLVTLLTLVCYLPTAVVEWPGGDVLAIHLALFLMANFLCGLMLSKWQQDRAAGRRTRLHWAPASIIAFFLVLTLVDSIIIVFSQNGPSTAVIETLFPESRMARGEIRMTFPGVTSHDFHEKEALYNEYLAKRRVQTERGWQVRRGWIGSAVAGQPARFRIEVTDREGQPIEGAKVQGEFLRPSDHERDQVFVMQPTEAPGRYEVELVLDQPGRWDLVLTVQQGESLHEVRAITTLASSAS